MLHDSADSKLNSEREQSLLHITIIILSMLHTVFIGGVFAISDQ